MLHFCEMVMLALHEGQRQCCAHLPPQRLAGLTTVRLISCAMDIHICKSHTSSMDEVCEDLRRLEMKRAVVAARSRLSHAFSLQTDIFQVPNTHPAINNTPHNGSIGSSGESLVREPGFHRECGPRQPVEQFMLLPTVGSQTFSRKKWIKDRLCTPSKIWYLRCMLNSIIARVSIHRFKRTQSELCSYRVCINEPW